MKAYNLPFVPLKDGHSSESIADDTDAVVTLSAEADERHLTAYVVFGYDDTPTDGKLQWSIDGTPRSVPITRSGAMQLELPMGIPADPNEDVVWTLTAGGTGVKGFIHVFYG